MAFLKKTVAAALIAVILSGILLRSSARAIAIDTLTYELDKNGAVLTECHAYAMNELIIPDYVNGYPVIGIAEYAFYNSEYLISVTFPKHLKYIERGAFGNCARLMYANFTDNAPLLLDYDVFYGADRDFCVYYPREKTGYTAPEWEDYKLCPCLLPPKRGDANLDGLINTGDVSAILAHAVYNRFTDTFRKYAADINNDGAVNTGDAVCLFIYVMS